ncbi:hypothetical protein CHS0354_042302 [Potamilus streckersoni]|uniref:Ras-associating domain-containing protein n=1 Tax=Potamilus streckersoni TaxID=2493646 RepID=A0AAE0SUI4_9BIVA|nr:hypothetical protein CHS0354_042302 [Potamilus streckersoni]
MNFNKKMDMATGQMTQIISVLVEGRVHYKNVTKKTTCGDVIKYLVKYSQLNEKDTNLYSLFASNEITEQELPDKTKIMKVADLIADSSRIHFILRKKSRFLPKVCIDKQGRIYHKSSSKECKDGKVEPTSFSASKQ